MRTVEFLLDFGSGVMRAIKGLFVVGMIVWIVFAAFAMLSWMKSSDCGQNPMSAATNLVLCQ